MPNLYIDLGRYQRGAIQNMALDDSDALEVLAKIEAASRTIDAYCRRHFYTETRTVYLTPRQRGAVEVEGTHPDIVSVSAVAVDVDNDRSYSQTLTENVDFELCALDADDETEPPYNALRLLPSGALGAFAGTPREVRITARLGYGDSLSAVLTSAGASVTGTLADANDTTLATSAVASPEIAPGMTLRIDSEDVYVLSGDASPFVVQRGVNGTTAAAHAAASVSLVTYPSPVADATALYTARLLKRRESPILPVNMGAPWAGQQQLADQLDADIAALLWGVRRLM